MNIQIFGRSKCFDTKKAERYFKEHRIKYQYIDMVRYGMSRGEFDNILRAVGPEAMLEPKSEGAATLSYYAGKQAQADKLFENQDWIRTPIVRNGKQATVGVCPDIWKSWE